MCEGIRFRTTTESRWKYSRTARRSPRRDPVPRTTTRADDAATTRSTTSRGRSTTPVTKWWSAFVALLAYTHTHTHIYIYIYIYIYIEREREREREDMSRHISQYVTELSCDWSVEPIAWYIRYKYVIIRRANNTVSVCYYTWYTIYIYIFLTRTRVTSETAVAVFTASFTLHITVCWRAWKYFKTHTRVSALLKVKGDQLALECFIDDKYFH